MQTSHYLCRECVEIPTAGVSRRFVCDTSVPALLTGFDAVLDQTFAAKITASILDSKKLAITPA